MFAYLNGILSAKTPVMAVIDCNGVGYEINIPLRTYDKLPDVGKNVKLMIHFTISDMEGIRLFGFYTLDEKQLFKQLITISKIGPKTALSILSTLSVNDLVNAVQSGDVGMITTIPGIGKKSAERLIIELQDKVKDFHIDIENVSEAIFTKDIVQEAESALLTLGYHTTKVKKALNVVLKQTDFDSSEEIIKAVIKYLYQKRNN